VLIVVHIVITTVTVAELINISSSNGVKSLAVIIIWEFKQILRNIVATKTTIITTIIITTTAITVSTAPIEFIA